MIIVADKTIRNMAAGRGWLREKKLRVRIRNPQPLCNRN